jgi:Fcf2 pre-rRNA processing
MAISGAANRRMTRNSKEGEETGNQIANEDLQESPALALVEKSPQTEKLDKKPVNSTATTKPPKAHSKEIGNSLTALIPGYVAPLELDTSSLNPYRATLSELTRKAERTDASTKKFVLPQSNAKVTTNFMPSNYAAYSFKLGKKKSPDLSAGKGWFGMMSCEITDQVKADLQVIRNRTYLNPKKFYKKADAFGSSHLQIGTVIEGSAEFYSSRLTNKERRTTLTQEIMADPEIASYAKRKFTTIQQHKQATTASFHSHKRKVAKKAKRGF